MPSGLKKRREFLHVQSTGRRFKGRLMVLLIAEHRSGEPRIGLTISRKVGNAVVRNKVRRRLREIIRRDLSSQFGSADHVIVAYQNAARADFTSLRDDLQCLLSRVPKHHS